ncbi:SGNH/GDSL hydrolase family protein [Rhodococcus pyridinivorans]|uniref:SGNH/GDSL hydrolase family protein n=1 Tax=Rhodococcus pyridinivorans TaxID=103816 RepID=UPI003AADB2D0
MTASWIFIAMALVVAAGAYWMISNRTPESEYVSTYIPSTPESAPPAPAAIFLGDSYTEGVRATEHAARYTTILCTELSWRCEVNGQGGTGYTNPGQSSQSESVYRDRIELFRETSPAIVVVQGSTNDSGVESDVKAAADAVFIDLRGQFPDAEIVAVGPFAAPGVDLDRVAANHRAVADAAAENGVHFIDPIGENWLPDASLYSDDQIHPNDAGYRVIADRLAQALTGITQG